MMVVRSARDQYLLEQPSLSRKKLATTQKRLGYRDAFVTNVTPHRSKQAKSGDCCPAASTASFTTQPCAGLEFLTTDALFLIGSCATCTGVLVLQDYSQSPSSTAPNAHDYAELVTIYGHTDSSNSYNFKPSTMTNAQTEMTGEVPLGVLVRKDHFSETYAAPDGKGGLWITHITLAPGFEHIKL